MQCLSLLEQLGTEGIVITKHGKPVARVLPIARTPGELIGALQGKIRIRGDLLTTGVDWDAHAGS